MSVCSALAVWGWRRLAIWASLLGRDMSALAWRERIAAARPDDADALASVAHLKARQGGHAEAIALLRRATALDPGRAANWYNLGYLQQVTEHHDAAIASFEHALAIDPGLDLGHYGLALSLIRPRVSPARARRPGGPAGAATGGIRAAGRATTRARDRRDSRHTP